MKIAIKQLFKIFVAFSLTVILASSGFINNYLTLNKLCSNIECSDISNHSEHSHSVNFEDDVLVIDSKVKSNKFNCIIDLIALKNDNFKNNLPTPIWQPPKIS
jgi:hypothetical protein